MENINERVRQLIQEVTSEHRRFKELEERTQISAATWKTFWNRGSNPSAQMIDALATHWPEYAFWLATGLDDSSRGHNCPIKGWKEEDGVTSPSLSNRLERTAAGRLFRAEIERYSYLITKLEENPHFEEDDNLVKLESRIAQLRHVRDQEESAMAALEKNNGD